MEFSLENRSTAISGVDLISRNRDFFSALIKPSAGKHTHSLTYVYLEDGRWKLSTNPKDFHWANRAVRFLASAETRPWILLNGHSDVLKNLRFTAAKKASFAVYLYEPIQFCDGSDPSKSWRPRDEKSVDFTSIELESLVEFAANNPHLDITIYVCDHGLSERLANHPEYGGLNVKTFDIFLVDHVAKDIDPFHTRLGTGFTKTALCLNYRYEFHREIVAAYLRGKNYAADTHLSFFHQHRAASFASGLPFPIDNWADGPAVRSGLQKMQGELPYTVDTENSRAFPGDPGHVPDVEPGINVRDDKAIGKFFEDSFVSIVGESRFFSYYPNISEKTLDPVKAMRPFIVVGAPGCLKYVRKLGFKTFHEFWDESYDEETDHQARFSRIFRLLDEIFGRTPEERRGLLKSMENVLIHNRLHLRYGFMNGRTALLR